MTKMVEVVTQLGTLYDELAKLEADAKIKPFTAEQLDVSSCM